MLIIGFFTNRLLKNHFYEKFISLYIPLIFMSAAAFSANASASAEAFLGLGPGELVSNSKSSYLRRPPDFLHHHSLSTPFIRLATVFNPALSTVRSSRTDGRNSAASSRTDCHEGSLPYGRRSQRFISHGRVLIEIFKLLHIRELEIRVQIPDKNLHSVGKMV